MSIIQRQSETCDMGTTQASFCGLEGALWWNSYSRVPCGIRLKLDTMSVPTTLLICFPCPYFSLTPLHQRTLPQYISYIWIPISGSAFHLPYLSGLLPRPLNNLMLNFPFNVTIRIFSKFWKSQLCHKVGLPIIVIFTSPCWICKNGVWQLFQEVTFFGLSCSVHGMTWPWNFSRINK